MSQGSQTNDLMSSTFSLQTFVEKMYARPSVSEDLWNMVYTLIGGGGICTVLGAAGVWQSHGTAAYLSMGVTVFGAACGIAGSKLSTEGGKQIPTKSKGVLTIWGKRQPVNLPEGKKRVFPWWPLYIDFETVDLELKIFKLTYTGVRCKAPVDDLNPDDKKSSSPKTGGAVTVKMEIGFIADGGADSSDRLIKFQNSGGVDGVANALSGLFAQAFRHQSSYYDWEQFSNLKKELSVALLAEITEINFRKLPREADGTISSRTLQVDPDKYKTFEEADPYDYLFPPSLEERREDDNKLNPNELRAKERDEVKARKCRDQDIAVFLRIARENGVSDINNLGVKIAYLNVTEIEPEGKLDSEADGVAIELQQRRKEKWDFETEQMLAAMYIKMAEARGETMSSEKALELARINRGRATEIIVRSSGNPLADAAALNNHDMKGKADVTTA
ncbi:MAG: hypothetical protein ABIT47_01250 [Candidatus Paceibacterota bacterium]